MKTIFSTMILGSALTLSPALAQEKKEMPMKGEAMQGSGMDMNKMKEMHNKMMEMKKGSGGMMKGRGMMKSEDMKGMGNMMGDMSGMMGNMGQMMSSGKMTPEQMGEMSKMM